MVESEFEEGTEEQGRGAQANSAQGSENDASRMGQGEAQESTRVNPSASEPADDPAREQGASPEKALEETDALAREAAPAEAGGLEDTDELAETRSIPDEDPQGETQPNAAPTVEIPRPKKDEDSPASFRDVTRAAGSFARGRWSALQVFLQGHTPITIGIAIILGVVVLVILLFASRLADLPPETLIRQDVYAHYGKSDYEPGAYGSDEPLAIEGVRILSSERTTEVDTCITRVELTLSNGSTELSEEVTLEYGRANGEWSCTNAGEPESLVYEAVAGVDTTKVADNVGLLLSKAESNIDPDDNDSVSLPTLYADADVQVIDERFDAQAQDDVVSLHLSRSSTFTSYECDISARFVFRPGNGVWELSTASASKNAKEYTLGPILGTWHASFTGQKATEGKCFGAKGADTTITITSVEGGRIAGTLTGLAHYHGDTREDIDGNEGDTSLESVAFTGTEDATSSGISFACSTPEDAKGTVVLNISFGQPDNPNAAVATITTTSTYESSFLFIPYDRYAVFTDSFSLTKE